jgi:hypothetical protein
MFNRKTGFSYLSFLKGTLALLSFIATKAAKSDTLSRLTEYPISNEQHYIICGSLLGDATVVKRDESYRIKFSHTAEHVDLINWKYHKLYSLTIGCQAPKLVIDKKGYSSYEFYLASGLHLKRYHEMFYILQPNGRYVKTITQQLIKDLPEDELTLATWYLDDGSVRNDCFSGKLATQAFSFAENQLLQEYLFEKFGITVTIPFHSIKKNQFYLGIGVDAFPILIEAIKEIVNDVPCMRYKLNELRGS